VSERLPLRGLELEQVGDFVRNALDGPPSTGLVARLHETSQGNPFFLDELVRMLRAAGRLEDVDGELGEALPDEVRQVIRRNLEPLSDEDRELLTMAAVLGYEFDLARLLALAELPSEQLLGRLQAARSAGVIDETSGASGRFRFSHMLIRDTFYGDLSPLDRAALHRRAGLALEVSASGTTDSSAAELAHHFARSAVLGDAGKALDYAVRAGEQALARLAYGEAVGHLDRALTMLRLDRSDEVRDLALRMRIGQALTDAGDHPRARATFERAAERARALHDAPTFARAALGYSYAFPGTGAVSPTLVALLEESLGMLGTEDSALRATLLGCLASALYFSRDAERRDVLSRDAVAMARRAGDRDALARALIQRHHVLWGPGSVSDRLALCDETIRLATGSGDRQLALLARLWRIVDLLEAGDVTMLDIDLEGFARQSDQARIPYHRWFAGVVRSTRALLDGRLTDSERLADEALALWAEGPLSLSAQTHALQRFMVCLETGRLAELEDTFTRMAREFPAIPGWQSGVALIRAESGRPEEARALLDAFASRDFEDLPRDAMLLASLVTFAQVAYLVADFDRATRLYSLLHPYAERNVVVGFAAGTYGSCARYLGLLATTMGRLDTAARHFEEALAANARLGSRPLVAQTQCDYARVAMLRQEKSKADTLLEGARHTAERLGLTRLLARIDEVAALASGPRAHPLTAVFRRDGSHWTMMYQGRTLRLRHMKGIGYLAMLLQRPGQDVHVLDLTVEPSANGSSRRDLGSDTGEVIDARARGEYKRRLGELQEELEEARGFNDLGRADRLQEELDAIGRALSSAIGLGGRHRKAGSPAERARINVSRTIAAVLRRITEEHPSLGEHLTARVHTGTFCSYDPDPFQTIRWDV
jgi:tetratricopeptide (TPR) repeat protein